MHYVYVLADLQTKKRYIGFTSDLRKRVAEHKGRRGAKATKHGHWKLVYYEAFASKADAIQRERRLKQDGRARYQLMRRIGRSLAGQE